MPRTATAVCTWLALLAAGCASTGPAPLVASRSDRPAAVVSAPEEAVYRLSRAGGWREADRVVVLRRLAAGDAVGFERGADGTRVAVAGDFRKPLPDGRYRWDAAPPVGRAPADHLDARLAGAGGAYMTAVEPVGGAIAAAVLAPVFLFMYVFHIPLPFGK